MHWNTVLQRIPRNLVAPYKEGPADNRKHFESTGSFNFVLFLAFNGREVCGEGGAPACLKGPDPRQVDDRKRFDSSVRLNIVVV